MRRLWLNIISFPIIIYQKIISPFFPPACRYYPSCSHYAYQAIQRHGFIKGFVMGFARILRCSALFQGGKDTVPLVHSWRFIFKRIIRDYRLFWNR